MFQALGQMAFRRRWFIIVAALAFVTFAVVWGTGVFGELSSGGYDEPSSESSRATVALDGAFGRDAADVVVLYTADSGTMDDPVNQRAVVDTLRALPQEEVSTTSTYWSTDSPSMLSEDRRSTYAVLQLSGADDDIRQTQFEDLEPALTAPGLTVQTGGGAALGRDIGDRAGDDLSKAETLSLPIVLVLLVVMLGGICAAGLPLAVGGLAILGAFTAIRAITLFTEVSVFAINIVTLLGLGLAIDYGLCMVSRFREELHRGLTVQAALSRTMATAGRTVAISGITVAIALSGLAVFPQVILRSLGIGGIAAVLVAMVGALTVMPAMLAVLGHRIDSLSVRPLIRRVVPRKLRTRNAERPGVWFRIARSVMRTPVLYVVGITITLLVLAAPFLRISFGGIDERALPAGTESRVVAETLQRDFGTAGSSPAEVAVIFDQPADRSDQQAELATYVVTVQGVPGVASAQVTGTSGNTARVTVNYPGAALSSDSRAIVEEIRQVPAPAGAEALVGGQTAGLVDLLDSLGATLPIMALIIVGATLVLLFLAFGSVVLPVKAVIMNVLSLGATFGALVWIFQDGHLSSLLGFTPTGTIDATQPVLMLAIAFGLSMDYEVFLLSRIREQYDLTGDNTQAVATGLQRTGGIITSAALLLVIVVGAFSTSGITFVKLIGVGMIIAIVIDATVVRILLVPATMRLMGRANWWAPGPLRRLYTRFGIKEGDGEDFSAGTPTPGEIKRSGGRHRAVPIRPAGVHRRRRTAQQRSAASVIDGTAEPSTADARAAGDRATAVANDGRAPGAVDDMNGRRTQAIGSADDHLLGHRQTANAVTASSGSTGRHGV